MCECEAARRGLQDLSLPAELHAVSQAQSDITRRCSRPPLLGLPGGGDPETQLLRDTSLHTGLRRAQLPLLGEGGPPFPSCAREKAVAGTPPRAELATRGVGLYLISALRMLRARPHCQGHSRYSDRAWGLSPAQGRLSLHQAPSPCGEVRPSVSGPKWHRQQVGYVHTMCQQTSGLPSARSWSKTNRGLDMGKGEAGRAQNQGRPHSRPGRFRSGCKARLRASTGPRASSGAHVAGGLAGSGGGRGLGWSHRRPAQARGICSLHPEEADAPALQAAQLPAPRGRGPCW